MQFSGDCPWIGSFVVRPLTRAGIALCVGLFTWTACNVGPHKTSAPSPTATPQNAIVTYTDSGFSPKVTTIKTGATVTFRNQSSGMFWPASGPHPAHTAYDGTSLSLHCTNKTATTFDACVGIAASQTYSFKFTKIGTWNYHDHLHSSLTGSVIVQ